MLNGSQIFVSEDHGKDERVMRRKFFVYKYYLKNELGDGWYVKDKWIAHCKGTYKV